MARVSKLNGRKIKVSGNSLDRHKMEEEEGGGPGGRTRTRKRRNLEFLCFYNMLCYFIVSGEAKFESKDQDEEILSSTKTRFHKSFQPHAITTIENKVLSFVIWKNKFENVSKMIKG